MGTLYLLIPLAPLLGAILAGFFGKQLGRKGAHFVTSGLVAFSFILSVIAFMQMDANEVYNQTVYQWAVIDNIKMEVGFLVDHLTIMMMLVVTFVSLMVHIYTIGYMHDDPGYQRFFSYISLFTFSMLMLVMSNNFLQLFFGWEAVGLVSYLLIGFWYKKDTAIYANMKAFLVNRVGDFGFLLGIGVIVIYANSLDYITVFERLGVAMGGDNNMLPLDALTQAWGLNHQDMIALLLFIGAMGKSAQVPLHVWLPDSMEGPTPISALIHAATMVTAGIFMVSRLSPIFELSDTVLNFILIIGATTAFFMGLIGIIQNDIKRVVAYSTLSQLGYMVVALGASAYSAAVFHLMTHAFFKALLFLAAGSVIIAMHHEQDIRKMGGLKRHMPITYWTSLVGSLALIGIPGFAGFFSKDAIIEAVHASTLPAAGYAYFMVLLGVFVTAFYSFRMFFLVFHGDERMDDHTLHHLHESPKVVTIPLILLAIPSVIAGYFIGTMVMGDFFNQVTLLPKAEHLHQVTTIMVDHERHPAMEVLREEYHGIFSFIFHGMMALPFWLALAGVGAAWYIYMKDDSIADWFYNRFQWLYKIFDNKYYFDTFNQKFFANGSLNLGTAFWTFDKTIIDGLFVNGVAKMTGWTARLLSHFQTGYLYHYVMTMALGVGFLMAWLFMALSA